MADTIGFEIDESIEFGDTGLSSTSVPSSVGFEIIDDTIEYGLTGIAARTSVTSPGFETDESELYFSGSSGSLSVSAVRSPGFEVDADVLDYQQSADTAYEIIAKFPVFIPDHEEAEVNTGDIRLTLIDGVATISMNGTDLARDAGLETALLISLFSDQRSTLEEVKGAGLEESDLRGWFGDLFEETPIGSKIWLLSRSKMTTKTYDDFREYALKAWAWAIEDGVVKSIEATVARYDKETIILSAETTRPDGTEETFKYYFNWQSQLARRA